MALPAFGVFLDKGRWGQGGVGEGTGKGEKVKEGREGTGKGAEAKKKGRVTSRSFQSLAF